MGLPERDPADLVGQVRDLAARVERLESRTGSRAFANADRPAPMDVVGMIIYNTTTGKLEASDGTFWQPLWP